MAGKVTEYSRGISPAEEPVDLAAGPDSAMWFTESDSQNSYHIEAKIGRITMNGKISEYSKSLTSNSDPTSIVRAPDGDMWFVETGADRTGRVQL
jgi:virginiamycin B lyase